jgi:hypothetical protein
MSRCVSVPSAVRAPLTTVGHAVVVGGSMAGLLAARVLADHFEQVTLVERDALTDSVQTRKGVPQGRMLHVSWSGCSPATVTSWRPPGRCPCACPPTR